MTVGQGRSAGKVPHQYSMERGRALYVCDRQRCWQRGDMHAVACSCLWLTAARRFVCCGMSTDKSHHSCAAAPIQTPGLDGNDPVRLLSDPDLATRTTTYLTTYMLVSGLLTTSTYQAFYTSLNTPADAAWAQGAFPLTNGISFAFSLACILVSSGAILIVNSTVPGAQAMRFKTGPGRYLKTGMRMSYCSLAISILAAVAAYAITSWALLLTTDRLQRVFSVACGCAAVVGAFIYFVLFFWRYAAEAPVASDRSKANFKLDDEFQTIVANRVLDWIEEKERQPDALLVNELTYTDLCDLLEHCRRDYRALKPNSVMPSALFTPWALADGMATSLGIAAYPVGGELEPLPISRARDNCIDTIQKTESTSINTLIRLNWCKRRGRCLFGGVPGNEPLLAWTVNACYPH